MIHQNPKFAFLVPFFGPLPPYFDFWAKSCAVNHERFHWFVYSDQITASSQFNAAVTMIPYQFEEMRNDFAHILNINIPEHNRRKVCDYRLMFYFLRRQKEPLDSYDYIGYTDVDMIYGKIADFMPENIEQYAMISANEGKPCGPFTLIKRPMLQSLLESAELKQCLEAEDHLKFDESVQLMNIIKGEKNAVFCHYSPLQPMRTDGFNYKRCLAIWENGNVFVRDCRGNKIDGAFFHFSRFKGNSKFKIRGDVINSPKWVVCRYGIFVVKSKVVLFALTQL
jgi:hypothetical protein